MLSTAVDLAGDIIGLAIMFFDNIARMILGGASS